MRLKAILFLTAAACSDPPPVDPPANPPPSWGVPIIGGTMLVTHDGARAVIADPDRDRLVSVDLASGTVLADAALLPGDEPGRLVEDAAGTIHVALRRGNAVVAFGSRTWVCAARRPACTEPRGLAYDAAGDTLHVACTSGELVSLPAAGGDATRRFRLDRDLRDVIVAGTQLVVTRFRTAEVLVLDAQGAVVSRSVPPTVQRADFGLTTTGGLVDAVPAVAWRAIALADGRILVSHQRQLKKQLDEEQPGGYGGGCGGGPVEAAVAVVAPGAPTRSVRPPVQGALPVDLAVNPTGTAVAFALAGNNTVHQISTVAFGEDHDDHDDCPVPDQDDVAPIIDDQLGKPTAVAYLADGTLAVYYPESPAIVLHGANASARTIVLPGGVGYDSGRALFHTQTSVGLACASCHPEGRDDGLVWQFAQLGSRRTQSLGGGILARAPYHWAGDEADLPRLMDDVFGLRMAGGTPTRSQKLMLGPWLDRVPAPAPAPVADAAAVERGRVLFESAAVGCAGCHNGALMTNNQLVDVGTNGTFKVPSLAGVAARPPFMHDGCAATLADRFGACGGLDRHGKTSQLTAPELLDLTAYLESL